MFCSAMILFVDGDLMYGVLNVHTALKVYIIYMSSLEELKVKLHTHFKEKLHTNGLISMELVGIICKTFHG